MKLLKFENDKGHILIEKDWITLFDNVNPNKSAKWPMSRVDEYNVKLLYDILKIANLGKLLLTEDALNKFDKIVKKWDDD